jgi:hypothetical protein
MKKYIILVFMVLAINLCNSQPFMPMTWFFGDNARLHFNTDGSTSQSTTWVNTIPDNFEGCTVLNDQQGNLIFYASGTQVRGYNYLLQSLTNSTSSTQSPIIVQIPGAIKNPTNTIYKFLLFVVDAVESQLDKDNPNFYVCYVTVTETGSEPSFNYSVFVDNPVLVNEVRMAEKLAVCKDNQQGSWLVTHDYSYQLPKNDFYMYHITNAFFLNVHSSVEAKNFLSSNYTIQTVGASHSGQYENAQGQIKFNRDKNLLGLTIAGSHYFEIYSFNNTTGTLGNSPLFTKTFSNSLGYLYGCEFSPQSHNFYVSEGQTISSASNLRNIYQLSIDGGILGTEYSLISLGDSFYEFCGLQLGPNDKIYCTHKTTNTTLSVINNPDLNQNLCNFQLDAVPIVCSSQIGLPTYFTLQRTFPEPPPSNCTFEVDNSASPIYNIQSNNGTASVQITINSNNFDVSSIIIDLVNFNIGVEDICRPSINQEFDNSGMIIEPVPQILNFCGTLSPYSEGMVVSSSHEVTWDFSANPVQLSNQIITLNLKFPKISDLSCCKAKYFASFRVTLMDADCHSSQTILYTSSESKESKKVVPITSENVQINPLESNLNIDSNTSLSELVFTIYPNPNDGTFFIKSNSKVSNFSYVVLDDHGRSISSGLIKDKEQKIQIPGLRMGLYFVKISYDNKEFITKTIVHSN